jgi:hypothetical protein
MITIRPTQWTALSTASQQAFENEMAAHLATYAPELAKVMGGPRLKALVQLGCLRGRAYGLTNKGPLRFYLETMLALGSSFDTDPVLGSATASLHTPALDQATRADALHAAIVSYLDEVNGPENEHAIAALRRIRDVPFEVFDGQGQVGMRAMALFRGGFPQKYARAGDAALGELLRTAARVSDEFAVRSDAGRLLVASLLYSLGHGVFSDPAYAWAGDTLRLTTLPEDERTQLLYRKARLYLSAVLDTLAQP